MAQDDDFRVAIFCPAPILSITIELRGDGDDIHLHPAGQGVWVARMVGELEAWPVLCALCGGETGALLRSLLEELPGEVRWVQASGASSAYVVDRRSGERELMAAAWASPPSRHELDDLFSLATAAALDSQVLVVGGALPQEAIPPETYRDLVTDARASGTTVVVDLGGPDLDAATEAGADVVHVNDWQLAEFVGGPVDRPEQLRGAAEQLLARGAGAAVVTRGGDPALVLRGESAWELAPPRFEGGAPEGCGDSMVGALAAALARGEQWEQALRLGAAAGAANFLRHGLGTGSQAVVEELLEQVELRPL